MTTTEEKNSQIGHAIAAVLGVLNKIRLEDTHLNEVYVAAINDLTMVAGVLIGQGTTVFLKPQENQP